jgi:integration host factor subunit beta
LPDESPIVINVKTAFVCIRLRDAGRKLSFGQGGSTTMTKSELIALLARRYPQLVKEDAEAAVKTIHGAMTQALQRGKRIEIRGFGSFCLNHRHPRVGRNPKSGEKVHVPEKYVPHFKAGKELRERIADPAVRD